MAKPDFSKLLNEQLAKAAVNLKPKAEEKPSAPPAIPSTLPEAVAETLPIDPLQSSPSSPEEAAPTSAEEERPVAVVPSLSPPVVVKPSPQPSAATVPLARQSNLNRVTVNLFDADRRALAVIKEKLASFGHDFTNRSDSIKIGLRLAAKASSAELSGIIQEVRSEDRRFSPRG